MTIIKGNYIVSCLLLHQREKSVLFNDTWFFLIVKGVINLTWWISENAEILEDNPDDIMFIKTVPMDFI